MDFLDIPNDLHLAIGEYLSIKDLSRLRRTCHRLSTLLSQRHYMLGVQDVGQLTALQWAAGRGYSSLVEAAILSGGEVDKQVEKQIYNKIAGRTPLHLAASGNHSDVVRILLKHGANISARDPSHLTPLHLAVSCKEADATAVLLENGAEISCRDGNGDTPGFHAAMKGGIACMQALVAAGFDLNARNRYSKTILHAAAFNKGKMLGYLLGEGKMKMAINARDSSGKTPLHFATNARNVRVLLKNGAEMEVPDEDGYTPADEAARRGCVPLMKAFKDAGFDLNSKGYGGCTVLHTAVLHWNTALVEYLLQGGAEVNAWNGEWLTPLAIAMKFHHPPEKIVSLLEEYGAHLEMKDDRGISLTDRIGAKHEYESGSDWDAEYITDAEHESDLE